MSGAHTQVWLEDVWKALLGKWHWNLTGPVNEVGRKVGHFLGYGMIGILFRNAWYSTIRAVTSIVRAWLFPCAAFLSIVSIFIVASLDEWHQKFLPQRVSSFHDVLLDTGGALFLNLVFWSIRAFRRRHANRAFEQASEA
jgi:VanZ family protein